jgi:hypothetical protein
MKFADGTWPTIGWAGGFEFRVRTLMIICEGIAPQHLGKKVRKRPLVYECQRQVPNKQWSPHAFARALQNLPMSGGFNRVSLSVADPMNNEKEPASQFRLSAQISELTNYILDRDFRITPASRQSQAGSRVVSRSLESGQQEPNCKFYYPPGERLSS